MAFALQGLLWQPSGRVHQGTLPTDMSCKETIRLMCEFIEGRLAATVAHDVSMHISRCQNCTLVLEAAEQTLDTYFGDPRTASPFFMPSRVA
jgi:hypothetical protein